MRSAEKESLFKSFIVFFVSLSILSSFLLVGEYSKLKHELKESIANDMRLCSYDLKCTQYAFDFVKLKTQQELYVLADNGTELYGLYPIPKNSTYALKLSLSSGQYDRLEDRVRTRVLYHALWTLLIIAATSILFSYYALNPLRQALRLTEEFSRDILHDLNTPLSSLRLNVSLLKSVPENDKKVERITRSIDTIVSLGENLRSYLEEHQNLKESVDVFAILNEKKLLYEKLYPNLSYYLSGTTMQVEGYPEGLERIFDNLLSNASKYNVEKGSVTVAVHPESMKIIIEDTGKGIKYPEKVFERFYKEHERGLGIGLHIVKKLCDQMNIGIHIHSAEGKGTRVELDFRSITVG